MKDNGNSAAGVAMMRVVAVLILAVLVIGLVTIVQRPERGDLPGSHIGELASQEIPNDWAAHIEEAAEESGIPAPFSRRRLKSSPTGKSMPSLRQEHED